MSSNRVKYHDEQNISLNKTTLLSTACILNFLDDKTLLDYRLTCQTTYQATQRISGLYQNQTQFILGTSPSFSSKDQLKRSWNEYKKSVDCDATSSLKPALLYKINDPSPALFIHYEFPEGEKVFENGRIYQCIPGESYTWQHNAAWLLSHIHLGRPFLLTSPFIRQFIFRQDSSREYSAWSKEAVALSKAGYKVTQINSRGYITFSPSLQFDQHKKCQMKDLNADHKEMKIRLKKILGDIYQKDWVLLSNKQPTLKDFEQFTLILQGTDKRLSVFWLNHGKIVNQSFANHDVVNIIKLLPQVNESTDNATLIKCIKEKCGCTFIKKDKQSFIHKQLTPPRDHRRCLMM